MVENVVTDGVVVAQVDLAGLAEVEVLGGDADQAEVDAEQEEDGLEGDVAHGRFQLGDDILHFGMRMTRLQRL